MAAVGEYQVSATSVLTPRSLRREEYPHRSLIGPSLVAPFQFGAYDANVRNGEKFEFQLVALGRRSPDRVTGGLFFGLYSTPRRLVKDFGRAN